MVVIKYLRIVSKIISFIYRYVNSYLGILYYKFISYLTNNELKVEGLIYKTRIHFKGSNNKLYIGKGSVINNSSIVISGDNHFINIGNNVSFIEGGRIRIQGEHNSLIIKKNSELVNVFFSIGDINSKVQVGENCLFSANVIFRNNDDHSILDVNNPMERLNDSGNIIIGDHVWISYDVTVLKGVNIGENSIIGTKSLVTKSIGVGSLAVGIPARVIKQNISWKKEWLDKSVS